MTRRDIPGQEMLKEVLMRMAKDQRFPHAMLMHGQEGGAALPLAMFAAQYLLCENQGDDVCGTCPACLKSGSLTHPDVHFVFPVNTTTKVKKKELIHSDTFIDKWRSAVKNNPFLGLQDWFKALEIENKQGFIGEYESSSLREKLALRSYEGGHRVFIIWNADLMNPTFANKMLKSFEEPNPKTVFILISSHPSRLLTTILSRVQKFQEEYLSEQVLADHLTKRFGIDEQRAFNYAFRAEGNINAAVKEVQHQGDPWLDDFRDWMRMSYSRDIIGLFKWSQKMASANRETERQFISGALNVLDRCFRLGWLDSQLPMEGDEAAFYKNFSPFINTSNIEGFMQLLEEASFHIERNVNQKIVWFDTSIKAVRLIHEGKKTAVTT